MHPAPRRVLVVDDNRDAAELLGEAVSAVGHLVRIAFDGASALEAARSFTPDVGLLDLGLPAMDGFELAKQLRAQSKGRALRLVAVTGYGLNGDVERSRAAGFDAHLVKPVELAAVLAAIDDELAN